MIAHSISVIFDNFLVSCTRDKYKDIAWHTSSPERKEHLELVSTFSNSIPDTTTTPTSNMQHCMVGISGVFVSLQLHHLSHPVGKGAVGRLETEMLLGVRTKIKLCGRASLGGRTCLSRVGDRKLAVFWKRVGFRVNGETDNDN